MFSEGFGRLPIYFHSLPHTSLQRALRGNQRGKSPDARYTLIPETFFENIKKTLAITKWVR